MKSTFKTMLVGTIAVVSIFWGIVFMFGPVDHRAKEFEEAQKEPSTVQVTRERDPSTNVYLQLVVTKIDENGYAWCGDNLQINKLVDGQRHDYAVGDSLVIQIY